MADSSGQEKYEPTYGLINIFGFQVSGNTVTELRRRGYDARGLKGGIGAWHAIGGPTVPLDQTTYET